MSGFINIEDCNFDDIFVKEIYHEPSDCTENSLLFYYLSCKGNREYNAEIECAINKNAKAIILDSSDIWYDDDIIKSNYNKRVTIISIVDLYKKIGLIASKFYGFPSDKLKMVAVTETNGKTSISHFIAQSF